MGATFWIKRSVLAVTIAVLAIGGAQYVKTQRVDYALQQGALWGVISAGIYLAVLWRKLRKNPACAIRSQKKND